MFICHERGTNKISMMKVGSISAGLSSLLYVSSREESLGKERRLSSGKAVIEPMTKGKIDQLKVWDCWWVNFFKVVICNTWQPSPSLTILVPWWFVIMCLMFSFNPKVILYVAGSKWFKISSLSGFFSSLCNMYLCLITPKYKLVDYLYKHCIWHNRKRQTYLRWHVLSDM